MENQVNCVHNEDCLITITKPNFFCDYVITSPPDFEEIGFKPVPTLDPYKQFLIPRLMPFPKNGILTVFISDRRYKGTTISKSELIQRVTVRRLLSHKIWVKAYNTNLYRPNFVHILTFGSPTHKATKPMPDVFFDEHHSIGKYRDNFSKEVVKKFIQAYTNENDIVYDPFMGSGTTALVVWKQIVNLSDLKLIRMYISYVRTVLMTRQQHEKWLKRMGAHPDQIKERKKFRPHPKVTFVGRNHYFDNLSNTIAPPVWLLLSGKQYEPVTNRETIRQIREKAARVGPAFNKGGLQLIPTKEIKYAGEK